jgi:magnesium chelatase family protein
LARTWSVALEGVTGHLVEVEADLAQGLPGLTLTGLPDAALNEARERVRAAVLNSREGWPPQRITVNLSPASLHKRGSGFDLALAVVVLAAAGVVPREAIARTVFLGELGLDGRVRPVRGVLPSALASVEAGFTALAVPYGNAAEAALVPGACVTPVATLADLLAVLRGELIADDPPVAPPRPRPPRLDLADVLGQPVARRAAEVAAAGGHHLALQGVPGAGKTMIAERLPGLLPPLGEREALEVTTVHSVAGVLPPDHPLITWPPYQSPHHTASVAALVGGGAGVPRPGAVSLAHRGVLFLDEAAELATSALDALRQPLESGAVVLARATSTVRYPAAFQLVLAWNPCPCGRSEGSGAGCLCPPQAIRKYAARLSGPLLDRVDLRIVVDRPSRADLLADRGWAEPSQDVAARVAAARAAAAERLAGTPWRVYAEVPGPVLKRQWMPAPDALLPLRHELERGRLSARGVDRVLRVAWTLADLAQRPAPNELDVAGALEFRDGRLRGAA